MAERGTRPAESSIVLADVPQEIDATRRMLTGLPGDRLEERAGELQAKLAGLDEEALRAPWTLWQGEAAIVELPRAVALRSMGISHMVHHRAQLGVYRRLLDVSVPGMYGP